MLTLYLERTSVGLAVQIALEEAGADYRAERVDFSKKAQSAGAYLAINPKGRVPALRTDQGVLSETPAILHYVATRFPEAHLLPADPFQIARALEFNTYLAATVHVAHAHGYRGARWADDPDAQAAMRARMPANMAACMKLIQDTMLRGPWVLGAAYSVCDAYLFTICTWLEGDGVEIAGFPALARHFAAVGARPATRRAVAWHR